MGREPSLHVSLLLLLLLLLVLFLWVLLLRLLLLLLCNSYRAIAAVSCVTVPSDAFATVDVAAPSTTITAAQPLLELLMLLLQ